MAVLFSILAHPYLPENFNCVISDIRFSLQFVVNRKLFFGTNIVLGKKICSRSHKRFPEGYFVFINHHPVPSNSDKTVCN